jgi:hypothetical protein
MSFFPKSADKGIPFVPREEVLERDEAKWKYLVDNYKPVDYEKMIEEEDGTSHLENSACVGGACEIVHTNSLSAADGTMFFTEQPDEKRWVSVEAPLFGQKRGFKSWQAAGLL